MQKTEKSPMGLDDAAGDVASPVAFPVGPNGVGFGSAAWYAELAALDQTREARNERLLGPRPVAAPACWCGRERCPTAAEAREKPLTPQDRFLARVVPCPVGRQAVKFWLCASFWFMWVLLGFKAHVVVIVVAEWVLWYAVSRSLLAEAYRENPGNVRYQPKGY